MVDILTRLVDVLERPTNPESYSRWLTHEGILRLMESNVSEEEIIVYASLKHFFLHGVLVPDREFVKPDIDDMLGWQFTPFDSWSAGANSTINSAFAHLGGKTYAQAEQIIFARTFEGVTEVSTYIEIAQRLMHVCGLHYMAERNAWCRLDSRGDIEESCRVIRHRSDDADGDATVVLMKREILAEYSMLTRSRLVRAFDSTLLIGDHFGGWEDPSKRDRVERHGTCVDVYYDIHVEESRASFARGVDVVTGIATAVERTSEKKYENYIAYDWKNGETKEISCSPDALSNYFTDSSLPFELSPAFFRPEVLAKFKSDREKYTLTSRSISCRGSWHLQSYDVNAMGQVHTYLIYLSRLPYEEQLHWKQYNEWPKGPISERAYKTDFQADWSYAASDPLVTLKGRLGALRCKWWKLRSRNAMDWAHYPVTQSNDEWRNELLTLHQLLVEGFEESWLREYASQLDRKPSSELRSLALLKECLIGNDVEEGHAKSIIAPLRSLNEHRNVLRGHASEAGAQELKSRAFRDHGGYREHYTSLVSECDESMRVLVEMLPGEDET